MPRFLMSPPTYYGIMYEINPWMNMRRAAVRETACAQWNRLVETLLSIPEVEIDIIKPQPGLPDMAFMANAGLVVDKRFIASKFRHPERQGETPHHEQWFASRGYEMAYLPSEVFFEGEGDALRAGDTWYEGYYFRSDARAHHALSEILGQQVLPLRLIDPLYYHLDTCFCPLDAHSVIIYPGAFDEYSLQVIRHRFPNVIEALPEESQRFCCNAIVIDDIIITASGCPKLKESLDAKGYEVHSLDFSEFIKAGGAAKCLVLRLR